MKKTFVLNKFEGPFDFELSAPSSFPWLRSNGSCSRLLRLGSGKLVLVSLDSIGTIEKPKLEVTIQSATPTNKEDEEEVVSKIFRILGLNQDLKGFYAFAQRDPVLRRVVSDFYGLRGYSEPTVFETIVIAILEQQVTLAYAGKMRECIVRKFGEEMKVNGQVYYAFPSPEVLERASIDQMKECKLSRYKASYIKGIANSIVKGEFDPEVLRQLSKEEGMERLMKFRGIGRWTAEYILVRGLGKNVIPADDVALRKTTSEYYFAGKELSGKEIREFAGQWEEYQGLAAFYLLYARRHTKSSGSALNPSVGNKRQSPRQGALQ